MVRTLLVAVGALLTILAVPSAADAGPATAPAAPPTLPACIRVQTQSRWIPYGYNHIVIIEDGCSKAATCSVSTDVNPTAQSADLASGQTIEVVTFMGSASSTFVAKVTCNLH